LVRARLILDQACFHSLEDAFAGPCVTFRAKYIGFGLREALYHFSRDDDVTWDASS